MEIQESLAPEVYRFNEIKEQTIAAIRPSLTGIPANIIWQMVEPLICRYSRYWDSCPSSSTQGEYTEREAKFFSRNEYLSTVDRWIFLPYWQTSILQCRELGFTGAALLRARHEELYHGQQFGPNEGWVRVQHTPDGFVFTDAKTNYGNEMEYDCRPEKWREWWDRRGLRRHFARRGLDLLMFE